MWAEEEGDGVVRKIFFLDGSMEIPVRMTSWFQAQRFLCIQEVAKLLGLIPHTTDEESYLDHNADVDFDKVTLMIALL